MVFASSDYFFFKQKTAYEMRTSDWSSDVCSSDLAEPPLEVGLNALKQWPEFLEIIAFLTVRDLFGRALFRTRAYVTQLGDVVFSVLLEAELGQKRAIIEFARNLPHRFGRVQNPLRVHPGPAFARFRQHAHPLTAHRLEPFADVAILDRKSPRLNSSH